MAKTKRYYHQRELFLDPDLDLLEDKKEEKDESPAELETNGPETKNGIIIGSLFVNVRKDPNFDCEVVETLRKGDEVIILGKVKDFYEVSTNTNKIAYIFHEFIKEV